MSFGYPGDNLHLEHHGVSEESFWPSFTDIMMVIVMVFLLITIAVILNNWTLISDLKESIKAQQVASSLAEDKQVENIGLEAKLTYLEKQLALYKEKTAKQKQKVSKVQAELAKSEEAAKQLSSQSREQSLLLKENEKTRLETQQTLQEKEKQLAQLAEQRVLQSESLENKVLALTLMKNSKKSLKEKLSLLQTDLLSANKKLKAKDVSTLKITNLQKELANTKKKILTNKIRTNDSNAQLQLLTREKQEQAEALQRLEDENKRIVATAKKKVSEAEEKLKSTEEIISILMKKTSTSESQLLSMKGEYDTLDAKYQKLLRPARSSKDKFVASVSYKKIAGKKAIRLKSSPSAAYKTLTKSELAKALEKLKKKHKTNLYVKIIIPENSGLSYNEAWRFTTNIQQKYDYYYQPVSKKKIDKSPDKKLEKKSEDKTTTKSKPTAKNTDKNKTKKEK